MSSSINILCGPVHSGKTTLLMNWLRSRSNIAGITTPIVNSERMFYDIAKQEYFKMQAEDDENALLIGRYRFSKQSFTKAERILIEASSQRYSYLIIDEIGPLELNDQGLHEALLHSLNHSSSSLIIVVRDSILQEMITKYHLPQAKVFSTETFNL